MQQPNPFKWRHYQAAIILLYVRWYLRYRLSYRDLEDMMAERGLKVDHRTLACWVLAFAPELEKRVKPQLKPTTDSWRVDETYLKVKGQWVYHYRAVDSDGNTLDFAPDPLRLFSENNRFLRQNRYKSSPSLSTEKMSLYLVSALVSKLPSMKPTLFLAKLPWVIHIMQRPMALPFK